MTAATDDEGFTVASGDGAPNDERGPGTDIARIFGNIDVDGDGSISREELWGHFRGSGDGLAKADFDKLFDSIDTDKSGGIDLGEYASFVEQVRRKYAGRKALRSSMKVATLRESLLEDRPKPARRATVAGAPRRTGLTRGSASASRRSGMLLSLRRQKATRRASEGDVAADDAEEEEAPARSGSVRWFDVEVREYGQTASDNPCVRAGVGLEMSWDFKVLEREHLDTFEGRRSCERAKNFMKEKKITRKERERILREYGATTKEIQAAAKRATIIRNARKRSVATQDQDQLKEDFENVVRLLKKISPFRRRRRKSDPLAGQVLDEERLHPTLMAMVGLDDGEDWESPQ